MLPRLATSRKTQGTNGLFQQMCKSEAEIAIAVLKVLASRPNGEANFAELKLEVPNYVRLDAEDQQQSLTRPNEEMWEQRLRNITSHKATSGNIIHEGLAESISGGLRLTPSGRSRVTKAA
jgi:hypothetical protein